MRKYTVYNLRIFEFTRFKYRLLSFPSINIYWEWKWLSPAPLLVGFNYARQAITDLYMDLIYL